MLGCGEWWAEVRRRGGKPLVEILPLVGHDVGRTLNDSASGTVTLSPCRRSLIRPWRDEVHLIRSGITQIIGVASFPSRTAMETSVDLRDLGAWFDRRLTGVDQEYEQEDLSVILQGVFEQAMAPDSSPNLVLNSDPTGVAISRSFKQVDRRMAGEEFRALVEAGLNYTFFLREMRTTGPAMPTPLPGYLSEDHITDWTIEEIGPEAATNAFVLGATQEIEGSAGGVSEEFGLVQTVLTNQTRVTDDATATELARSLVEAVSDPPFQLSGTLTPESPYALEDLVPGVAFTIHGTFDDEEVHTVMRLTDLPISVGESEQIQVVLQSI